VGAELIPGHHDLPGEGPGLVLLCLFCLAAAVALAFVIARAFPTEGHNPSPVDTQGLQEIPPPGHPPQPPLAKSMRLAHLWAKTQLPVGAPAPPFTLPALRGDRDWSLADFRGRRPVVLVFGSLSCDLFCKDVGKLERFYQRHRGGAAFLFVVVREAGHPVPGLHFLLEPGISAGRRRALVRKAARRVGLTMPAAMDGPDERVMNAYRAFPRRVVVVDRAGRIALDLGTGVEKPGWDFSPIERWLRRNTPAVGSNHRGNRKSVARDGTWVPTGCRSGLKEKGPGGGRGAGFRRSAPCRRGRAGGQAVGGRVERGEFALRLVPQEWDHPEAGRGE
jgi:hypothetical protein